MGPPLCVGFGADGLTERRERRPASGGRRACDARPPPPRTSIAQSLLHPSLCPPPGPLSARRAAPPPARSTPPRRTGPATRTEWWLPSLRRWRCRAAPRRELPQRCRPAPLAGRLQLPGMVSRVLWRRGGSEGPPSLLPPVSRSQDAKKSLLKVSAAGWLLAGGMHCYNASAAGGRVQRADVAAANVAALACAPRWWCAPRWRRSPPGAASLPARGPAPRRPRGSRWGPPPCPEAAAAAPPAGSGRSVEIGGRPCTARMLAGRSLR